jgi:hypothetical protein
MQIAISAVVMLLLFVGIPLCLVFSLRRRSLAEFMYGRRGERRSMSAIGSSLLELDRLLSRPAVEYRVKMDDQAQAVKDEHGGE